MASYTIVNGAGTISYTYTLNDNTSGAAASTHFTVTVADTNGDPASGDLVIAIQDDKPTANPDAAHLSATDPSASGTVLTNDVLGADGAPLTGAVVGIASNNNGTTGTVGVGLAGAHGTLTIDAQGHYTYTRTSSGTDIFTYTITDADGTQSTSQLTIAVDNATPGGLTFPIASTPGVTEVFEAGLLASRGVGESAGSDAGNPDGKAPTQASGSITFTSLDGVGSIKLFDDDANPNNPIISLDSGHQSQTFISGLYTLLASYTIVNGAGTISYTYTLNDNTSGAAASTHFTVTVADTNGDPASGDLVIAIQDDHPIAKPDTDLVAANQVALEHGDVVGGSGTTSGAAGVDVLGADGPTAPNSPVVGVLAGLVGTPLTGVGTPIHGLFGDLTLFADGHYNYQRFIGVAGGDDHVDPFTYTIQDGDGSQATATLNITVANSAPVFDFTTFPQPGDANAIVFEAGLPERTIGGIKESAGSNPADQIRATGTIDFTSVDGVSSVTLGGHAVGTTPNTVVFADATGSLAAWYTIDALGVDTIHYSYTLLDNTLGDPNVNNGNTSVSFGVAVSDLDGNSTPGGNLVIDIVDDTPVAHADTVAVVAGQVTESGNVITGEGTVGGVTGSGVDVPGADGAVVVSIAAGAIVKTVDAKTGATITTALGTLTIDAQGFYSYQHTGGGGTDIFNYTIRDGDGNTSSTQLTFVAGNSVPGNFNLPPGSDPNSGTEVFEAGLAARTIVPGILESAGSHVGEAGSPTRTSGVITFTSPLRER